tara:strand:- start:354 stop:962 length:609 start_codon:yes stop_codon:yes gene_type:complete
METLSIHQKLSIIQNKAKVPKNNKNKFGGYNYRNLENILDVVKKLCSEQELSLTIEDKLIIVADRLFVESTATLTGNKDNFIATKAYAEHAKTKKGCDEAQLTGLTTSYARKYAVQGLFAIDDGVDNDAVEQETKTSGKYIKPIVQKTIQTIFDASSIEKYLNTLNTVEDIQIMKNKAATKYPAFTNEINQLIDTRLQTLGI